MFIEFPVIFLSILKILSAQKIDVFHLNYSFFCPLDSAAGGGCTTLPAP